MNTTHTRTHTQLASDAYSHDGELARPPHQEGYADDSACYWEQANEAFDELDEVEDSHEEGDTIPDLPPVQQAQQVRHPSYHDEDAPTRPVELLSNPWDWE